MANELIGAEGAPSPARRNLAYADITVEEPIGSGGTAAVHRATAPDGTPLAVKQPHIEGTVTSTTVERFHAEAETWADVDDHPHMVGIVDWDTEPLPWIAMEYMDGGSLGDRIGGEPLTAEEIVRIGTQACAAVRHAHRHGIVHLDLKPENLLFRTTDGNDPPVLKVGDWGLARSLREHDDTVNGLSPRYAAPEQFDEDAYGAPDDYTDIYQLGAILYEAATGHPPFEGSSIEVTQSVLTDEPSPPTALNPTLPAAIDDILLPALATEKAARYETVVDLRRALAAVTDDEPPARIRTVLDDDLSGERGSNARVFDREDFVRAHATAAGLEGLLDDVSGGWTATPEKSADDRREEPDAGSVDRRTAGDVPGEEGDGNANADSGALKRSVPGVVTNIKSNGSPEIKLADSGATVTTSEDQVVDDIGAYEGVEADVMEIDGERYITEVRTF